MATLEEAEIERLEAEIERLRAALQEMIDIADGAAWGMNYGGMDETIEKCRKVLNQQLADDDREPDPADEYAQAFDNKCR
jgi:hypothetical protein